MKRVFVWILGLGGVVIVALLVLLFVMSHRLKGNIEDSINTQLQALQESMPEFSYEPFSCSGLKQIACKSSSVGFEDMKLENVRLEVGQFTQSQGSVRLVSEKISFAGEELLTLLFGVLAQDVDFSNVLLPKSLDCSISGVLGKSEQAQDVDIMDTTATCLAKGENLSYSFAWGMQAGVGAMLEQAPAHFSDALFSMIKAYEEDSQKVLTQTPVLFKSAKLSLEPRDLASAIIAKLAKDKELEPQAYQQQHANLARSLQSMKAFIMYIALLSDTKGKAQSLEPLVDGLVAMVLGENNGVVYELKHNETNTDKPLSLGEWLHNPVQSLQKSGAIFSFEEVPLDSTKVESKKD